MSLINARKENQSKGDNFKEDFQEFSDGIAPFHPDYLLVDANNLCCMAFHTLPGDYEEKADDIIGRFFEMILTTAELFRTNQVNFFWDSRKSFRKMFLKSYKSNRVKDDSFDCLFDAMKELEVILYEIGFNSYFQTGFEADDLIASAAINTKDCTKLIVSSDKDLWQLIDYNTQWYSPKKRERYTHEKFFNEFGLGPAWWARVKAIAGCSSDLVKGIDGVGEKTAVKYLKKELGEHTKAYQKIKENESLIKENMQYVLLPLNIKHKGKVLTPNKITIKKRSRLLKGVLKDTFYDGNQTYQLGKKWLRWEAFFNGFK